MRRVPIHMKLAGAVIVPLVALLLATGLEAKAISREVDQIKDQAELAEISLGPSSLVTMLEYERDAASVHVLGTEDFYELPMEDVAETRARVDDALAQLRADLEEEGGDLPAAFQPAMSELEQLGELRDRVDRYDDRGGPADIDEATGVFDGYSHLMDVLFSANRQVTFAIRHKDLRQGAELYDLSARQTDAQARLLQELLVAEVEGDGVDRPEEIAAVARLLGAVRTNEEQLRLKATGSYKPLADELFATDHITDFPRLAAEALETGVVDVGAVMAASTGDSPDTFGYTVFREGVSDRLAAEAAEVRDAADGRLGRYVLFAGLAVVLAVVAAWAVARSITRPLRSLTRQAKDVAGTRLPSVVRDILETPLGDDVEVPHTEPVVVQARDEVRDVVDALNKVQESALDLAVEQAVLRRNIADSFVNLGRRNQNLLGRQLDFITELESHETDPETLASLFRLDHLATRMRRNAESLLLLAGIDPPRKWAAPVRIADIIRAALGEVEDYHRVALVEVEPEMIVGSTAADIAHMLAELIENAVNFSPPDEPVEVRGWHDASGYTLAVLDAGFGMSDDDVVRANRRLAAREAFTVAPSKYLGHYVAGNLAARHGIAVRLERRPVHGMMVVIELPASLVATETAGAAVASLPLATAAAGRASS